MLCTHQHEQCLTVCDKLLECCSQDVRITKKQTTDTVVSETSDSKRKRECPSPSGEQLHLTGNTLSADEDGPTVAPSILASVYKADALLMLVKLQEAYDCINR